MVKFLVPLFALSLLLVGCNGSEPTAVKDRTIPTGFDGELLSGKHMVTLQTSKGDIVLELDADAAPKTVTNFIVLAKTGYFDALTFHRVIPDFMIQGGDPNGNGSGGESIFGASFPDEINADVYGLDEKKLKDVAEGPIPAELEDASVKDYYALEGFVYDSSLPSLPMVRGSIAMANRGPNTNGSQFFIIQRKEGTPWLEGRHTVFGKVVEGMDVIDAIVKVERDESDKPKVTVTYTVEVE